MTFKLQEMLDRLRVDVQEADSRVRADAGRNVNTAAKMYASKWRDVLKPTPDEVATACAELHRDVEVHHLTARGLESLAAEWEEAWGKKEGV